MKLAFSKSGKPLSRFIRWGLGEPTSHFIIVFSNDVMFQSNLLGTGLDYWPFFRAKEAECVFEIPVDIDKETEAKIFNQTLMRFSHLQYDWLGFFYFMWRAFLWRALKEPMPLNNKWGQPNQFLCVGLIKVLDTEGVPLWLRDVIQMVPDCDMISPYRLYELLVEAQKDRLELLNRLDYE